MPTIQQTQREQQCGRNIAKDAHAAIHLLSQHNALDPKKVHEHMTEALAELMKESEAAKAAEPKEGGERT